jgi:hypothetical protein
VSELRYDEYDEPEDRLLGMKKPELRSEIRRLLEEQYRLEGQNRSFERRLADLKREVDTMREHWRPVPMTHAWQPRNPQCALCDEPRDAARHQVDD